MPKLVDHDERRLEIANVALQLIYERGLSNTSLREIARHAGCQHTGLIHYFANKQSLLVYLFELLHERWSTEISNKVRALDTAEQALREVCISYLPGRRDADRQMGIGVFAVSLKLLAQENEKLNQLCGQFSLQFRNMLRAQMLDLPLTQAEMDEKIELLALMMDGLALDASYRPKAFDLSNAVTIIERQLAGQSGYAFNNQNFAA